MADRPFVGVGSSAYASRWEATFMAGANRLSEHQKKLSENNLPIRLTQAEFSALPEYSCTIPTDVVIGKRWRRDANAYTSKFFQPAPEWWLGEYIIGPTLDTYTIIWRPIEVVP